MSESLTTLVGLDKMTGEQLSQFLAHFGHDKDKVQQVIDELERRKAIR
jgi:hypothetical protein